MNYFVVILCVALLAGCLQDFGPFYVDAGADAGDSTADEPGAAPGSPAVMPEHTGAPERSAAEGVWIVPTFGR